MADTRAWLDRLTAATNSHDPDAVAACFADDYANTTPAHPSRAFVGRDQVRGNWEQIFGFVPDIRTEVVAAAFDGATVWSQLDMRGTRSDGSTHHVTGVVIFTVDDSATTATAATFFLEPVDDAGGTVEEAVRVQVAR
jgi:ketosteroid isomerase-like protein